MIIVLILLGIVHMDVRHNQRVLSFASLSLLILGFLFYLFYRPLISAEYYLSSSVNRLTTESSSLLLGSFPSFIFIPLISAISLFFVNARDGGKAGLAKSDIYITILFWLGLVVLFECLQATSLGFLSQGTFDWFDIIAALFSAALTSIFLLISLFIRRSETECHHNAPAISLPLLVLGCGAILGSGYDGPCEGDKIDNQCVTPILLSWEDVRVDIQVDISSSEVLVRTGKIYSLDNWLFIVEKYRGIHIFDVTDKLNPVRKMYLPIPGALDLTINKGVLYSSAFSDLIMIDLDEVLASNGTAITAKRQIDVFSAPDRFQFFPDIYYMQLDQTPATDDGVVIGYKTLSGKEILYGDEYDLEQNESDYRKDKSKPIGCRLSLWVC